MITSSLGSAAVEAYSSSIECMNRYKAGSFGAVGSVEARLGFENCLQTEPRTTNITEATAETRAVSSMISNIALARLAPTSLRDTQGVGAYVPDCAHPYRPCGEIEKAKANGIAVTSSLQAKCAAWMTACGGEGDDGRYQTEGETIDPNTGLPIEPWYMNKTYWLIGGAALLGAALLLKR